MLCAIPLAMEIRGYFLCEEARMTQVAPPAETHTTLPSTHDQRSEYIGCWMPAFAGMTFSSP
jgi:hypothetical protein